MSPRNWITPNRITLTRVLLGSAAIAMYASMGSRPVLWLGCFAVTLTAAAIALDGVDGWLARRMKAATAIGAQLDVLGDRVIENLYFIYFAANGEIPIWIPVIFFVRGAVTDFLRGVAARGAGGHADDEERAEFRRNWFLRSRLGTAIVASQFSRGLYAAMKCACFCALGAECTVARIGNGTESFLFAIHTAVLVFVWATTVFCVLRALPVLWEGRKYFGGFAEQGERKLDTQPRDLSASPERRGARPIAAAS
ncbi:MAG TPA: CDP-alcohol phosphatidyltransferase family protein [Candidatus Acidoferrales bacterium]|nr:CDP-alcohol phosphatidyltransferase family protein [Candidatus Acidoferrales bacterium]